MAGVITILAVSVVTLLFNLIAGVNLAAIIGIGWWWGSGASR